MADFGGNMALNIEQRLGQKLTNEQQLLWDYMLQRWPNLTFKPLVQIGIGGNLLIYNANTLYMCYSLHINNIDVLSAALNSLTIYNELNALSYRIGNIAPVWDTTAAAMRYAANSFEITNIIFSRIAYASTYFKFIGYVITI